MRTSDMNPSRPWLWLLLIVAAVVLLDSDQARPQRAASPDARPYAMVADQPVPAR